MQNMNMMWSDFLNCAGFTVVGIGILLFAICTLAVLMTMCLCERQTEQTLPTYEMSPAQLAQLHAPLYAIF